MSRTRRACIITFTPASSEPRVLRQIAALQRFGWEVTVAGFPGRQPLPVGCGFLDLTPPDRATTRPDKLHKLLELFSERPWPDATGLSLRLALSYHWIRHGMAYSRDLLLAHAPRCDLVIAHDYYAAPQAALLARRDGARWAVDVHEYALAQYTYATFRDRAIWSQLVSRYIRPLQDHFYPQAFAITTVCEGIANLLQADHKLDHRPAVIRNVPFYEQQPFRPCSEVMTVVYHGIITPNRNLDTAVRSVKLWRPEFRLTIRGPADPGYDDELRALAVTEGVANRVSIEDPVPFSELVSSANQGDIGYLVLENFSPQREFSLPNKFFEYIMAGIALVISDLSEMRTLLDQHELGIVTSSTDPQAIAAAINSLSRQTVDNYKINCLRAARQLCWEEEEEKLVDACAFKD